jgi:hypothetical protein
VREVLSAGSHPPAAVCLAHVLVFPTWAEAQSYELFDDWDRTGAYFGILTTERQQCAAPSPNQEGKLVGSGRIREVQFSLPAERVEPLLNDLRNCRVPVLVGPEPFGFDGAFYEARIGYGRHRSVFHWWSSYPEEWRPLVQAIQQLMQLFQDSAAGIAEQVVSAARPCD